MIRATLKRLAVLSVVGTTGCGEAVLGPGPAADPVAVFDAAWRGFDRFYAFFEHNGLDWDAVYREHRPRVHERSTDAELQRAVCGIVAVPRVADLPRRLLRPRKRESPAKLRCGARFPHGQDGRAHPQREHHLRATGR